MMATDGVTAAPAKFMLAAAQCVTAGQQSQQHQTMGIEENHMLS
jgi:hypothetical protein